MTKEEYIGVGGWEDEERVFCESWPPCSGVTKCHSLLHIYLSVHSQLPSYWKKHGASVCCAKRESDLLCVSELRDGAGLAISSSKIRTESWHKITQLVMYTACERRNELKSRCVWFQALHSPLGLMYSKLSLNKQVLMLVAQGGLILTMWLRMTLSFLTSYLSLTGVKISSV